MVDQNKNCDNNNLLGNKGEEARDRAKKGQNIVSFAKLTSSPSREKMLQAA